MSQQFQVLKCFKCCTFQVHQVKKSIKWDCKMCGEKQSVKRNYGTGTGKECRHHVQQLNSIRGEIAESQEKFGMKKYEKDSNENSDSWKNVENGVPSKCARYMESERDMEPNLPEGSADNFRDSEVVLELPKNMPRKRIDKRIHNDSIKRSKPLNSDPNEPETLHALSNDNLKFPVSSPFNKEIPSTSNLNDGKLVNNRATHFETCKLSKNSKWARFVDENVEEEVKIDGSSDDESVIEQPKASAESKWSKYVKNKPTTTGCTDNESRVLKSVNTFSVDVKPMLREDVKGISFSQCSDEDIDSVLDF